jgi:hypothetical protein
MGKKTGKVERKPENNDLLGVGRKKITGTHFGVKGWLTAGADLQMLGCE